ncbi:NEP1-interacting protein 2-like [Typha angustifolia]|uniref:NEP1-interacting protein 2-like n=1 Tax=Typha angustifolia TaxID=59011 RepID=UPI003C2CC4B1
MEISFCEPPALASTLCMRVLRKVTIACLTCIFSLCGAIIGLISGALQGQTTETGLLRGAGIGIFAGALVGVEVLESYFQGELLSKVAIFDSLVNGKIFREWVSPAMLKAYQWQTTTTEEAIDSESSDIFDTSRVKGLLPEIIRKLPEFDITLNEVADSCGKMISCAVCLQDFKEKERARRMPICGHFFHIICIDRWLVGHDSCPICRQYV